MCLLVCLKTLLGPSGGPNTPHLPLSPISLSVPLHAKTPWLGFLCIQMPSIWLSVP